MNAFILILGLSRTQEGFEALDCAKVMDAGQTWRCLCKFLQLDLDSQSKFNLMVNVNKMMLHH